MEPRLLLFALLSCFLLLGHHVTTNAQTPAESSFALKQVGPNVWAAISDPRSKVPAGANTGFVIGDDGVAIIDPSVGFDPGSGFSTGPATELFAAIRTLTQLPVKFVINTHHHLDHVGANAVFANAGTVVVAQHNVRDWIRSENVRLFGTTITPQQETFIESFVPPTITYDQQVDLHLGSREIRLVSFPGHTGSDSIVLIPDANVVFAGDLFWRSMLPSLVDASTEAWIGTLDTLAKNGPDATFVPGHGDVGTAQDLGAFRQYLRTLRTLVSEAQVSGKSGEALADAITPALRDAYGSWESFDTLITANILAVDAELAGRKRVPQAQRVR